MKTTLGVGISVLSTLAAQGKDFDRTELNAMLDRLAASPEPKIKPGPMACCYKVAEPSPVECRHVCKKCGTVTRYVSADFQWTLAFLRDGAAVLKGMGLDIALDESALCRQCSPGPKMPRTARVVKASDAFAVGDEVDILWCRNPYVAVVPRRKVLWVAVRYVDREKSCVVADNVNVRLQPRTNGRPVDRFSRNRKVRILPSEKGDSKEWLRIDASDSWVWKRGVQARLSELGGFTYGEGDFGYDTRVESVAWVINGKRTAARRSDVGLLKAFLSGKLILKEGRFDEEVPLKRRLDRLRELLGGPRQ